MFVNLRRVHKVQLARLLTTGLALCLVALCWEELDHHVVSHVRSYTYRYLYNRYDFLNSSYALANPRSSTDAPPMHRYLINPEPKCAGKDDVLLLLFVKSSPENTQRRQNIRQTWGDERYVREQLGANVRVLFALGVHPHPDERERRAVQRRLETEHWVHEDLVQQDFNDTFHNLTTKLIMQFHWAAAFCPKARFVMTADDDVFVHVPNLVRYLRSVQREHEQKVSSGAEQKDLNFWAGHVHKGAPPIRRRDNKYFVPVELYPWPAYPDYTSGAGYVVSGDAALRIHQVMQVLNSSMYIDDVFMGMCAEAAGLPPQDYPYFAGEGRAADHPCIYSCLLTSHGHVDDMLTLWQRATDPGVQRLAQGSLSRLYCGAVRLWLLCPAQCKAVYT